MRVSPLGNRRTLLKIDSRFCIRQLETSLVNPVTTVSLKRIIRIVEDSRHLPTKNHELHRF